MFNKEQIENIKSAEKLIFTTADKNNQPRSIWVMPSRVDADIIILANIQMNKSFENIKQNPKCFLNVYIPEKDDLQYKIEGVAKIYESGELFEEIKNYEESENLPPELKVNAVIVVEIKSFEESIG